MTEMGRSMHVVTGVMRSVDLDQDEAQVETSLVTTGEGRTQKLAIGVFSLEMLLNRLLLTVRLDSIAEEIRFDSDRDF